MNKSLGYLEAEANRDADSTTNGKPPGSQTISLEYIPPPSTLVQQESVEYSTLPARYTPQAGATHSPDAPDPAIVSLSFPRSESKTLPGSESGTDDGGVVAAVATAVTVAAARARTATTATAAGAGAGADAAATPVMMMPRTRN
ncbi:uncharacterized protein ATNIH1004_008603 [Aspergillus tanneri]|uniref:Uncharacterized protein n=1 Tax=Aspergillus tanneri TaxID=1220188 RepID=A0A5M9MIZ5_9EURO|nr:uncharacterized protein ATNIH1004_008603 [Aspergillus tanneri]KAA8644399.1 hypothetical protein ATNIH1004_008603 [Aspergillus tanneri]